MAKRKEPDPITDGAIIPVDTGNPRVIMVEGANPLMIPEYGTPIVDCPSNIDMTSQQGFALAFNAIGEADLTLDARGEIVLDVKHWLIHPAEKVDEATGEVSRFARLVLITPEGRTFATTSPVVMARLAQLCAYYGHREDWQTVRLRVMQRKSKKPGRTYHDLRIDLQPEE